jgi:hypothetical protein
MRVYAICDCYGNAYERDDGGYWLGLVEDDYYYLFNHKKITTRDLFEVLDDYKKHIIKLDGLDATDWNNDEWEEWESENDYVSETYDISELPDWHINYTADVLDIDYDYYDTDRDYKGSFITSTIGFYINKRKKVAIEITKNHETRSFSVCLTGDAIVDDSFDGFTQKATSFGEALLRAVLLYKDIFGMFDGYKNKQLSATLKLHFNHKLKEHKENIRYFISNKQTA